MDRNAIDEDGMWHVTAEKGGCACREHLTEGPKSLCGKCGETYTTAVGGGTGCTKCFSKDVSTIPLSRGATKDEAEIVGNLGVGRAAWNEQRIRWNKTKNERAERTQIPETLDFEAEVTAWLQTGGNAETRPRYNSIPLGYTIKCLQHLETWVPIGRLK